MMDYLSALNSGYGQIADTMKIMVYQENNDLFKRLDFEDDVAFTEPLLFSYFNRKNKATPTLDQLLWGYLEEKDRPMKFKALANDQGVIYLPKVGFFDTQQSIRCQFELKYEDGEFKIYNEKKANVEYKFEPIDRISETTFQYYNHHSPLLREFFLNEKGSQINVVIKNDALMKSAFEDALKIIKTVNPKYFNLLERTLKGLLMYEGEPNSFATLSAHGIAFFNVKASGGLVFFLDNIVHQCGHIIFNVISFEKQKWFTVSPDMPLGQLNGSNDKADIYGRFHGLFTQTNVNDTIDKVLDRKLLEGNELFELAGRFSSNMKRFKTALARLNVPKAYTNLGRSWYEHFEGNYHRLYKKRASLIEAFEVSNQPYVFDFEIFKKSNSIDYLNELVNG